MRILAILISSYIVSYEGAPFPYMGSLSSPQFKVRRFYAGSIGGNMWTLKIALEAKSDIFIGPA